MDPIKLLLFPHVLVRLGGSSYDALEGTQPLDVEKILSELNHFEQSGARQKVALCDDLLAFIRTLDNAQAQNQIQNLRRDLYNERLVKAGPLQKAMHWMPEPLQYLVQRYLDGEKEREQRHDNVRQQYEQQVRRVRRQLQVLSREEALQKGLVLSSQAFLGELPAYQIKHGKAFGKKDFHTEQSLLKYLTRIKAKTSPFSTFNNLCLADVAPAAVPIQPHPTGHSPVTGYIRLNNQLFQYLKGLLTHYLPFYQHLLLRVNPSVTVSDEHFTYLTNHYNLEAFQRLPRNPIVALIQEIGTAEPGGISFRDLVDQITGYVDATPAAIEQYARQLISYGFLEFDFRVSGIDPNWDEKLIEVLQPLRENGVPFVQDLITALRKIRAWAEHYAEATVAGRQKVLLQAYDALRDVCMRLHEAAGLPEEERQSEQERLERHRQKQRALQLADSPTVAVTEPPAISREKPAFQHHSATAFHFKPEQLFYEDTLRPAGMTMDSQALQQWVMQVEKLLQALPLFRGHHEERLKMKHYFLKQYASDAAVPVLRFYEDYYRDVKKAEAEQNAAQSGPSKKSTQSPDSTEKPLASLQLPIPGLEQWRNLQQQWDHAFAQQLQSKGSASQDMVNINYDDIAAVNGALGLPNAPVTPNSYGAFVQFYQEKDTAGNVTMKGVVNALLPGYGRMISRFLHILPDQVLEDVRRWNRRLEDDNSLLIENCDASYFNANLHPPLLPFEVRIPGGHNSLPASRQIPVTEFVIRCGAADEALHLMHEPSGKRAYVLDLGFQGQLGRSPLFQLLEKFTKAEYRYTRPMERVVNQWVSPARPDLPSIRVHPRISYENQVILQRKTWLIPAELLPLRKAQESDADYYLRINRWRLEHGMPEVVFATLNFSQHGETTPAQKQAAKLSRDDYKPQYISFANPLLVGLLEKLLAKEPPLLILAEMLPRGDQMLKIQEQKYVTEYVVQWYTPGH